MEYKSTKKEPVLYAHITCRCAKCGYFWQPTNNIIRGKLELQEDWNICKKCGDCSPWTNKHQFNKLI